MAPLMFLACRLLCFSTAISNVLSTVVYDHTGLGLLAGCLDVPLPRPPPFSWSPRPSPLQCPLGLVCSHVRRRKRGKRGGLHAKERLNRTALASKKAALGVSRAPRPRSWRECYRWLAPACPEDGFPSPCVRPPGSVPRGRNIDNLRALPRVSATSDNSTTFRLALCNVRSINNKTFVLNNTITSRDLDLFMLTETWIRPGDVSAFSELLPPDYTYLNTPRGVGKGGGIATIHKQQLKCRPLSTQEYSSFELQAFILTLPSPIFFGIIYRPPKSNKDFFQEFSDFLAGLLPKFDNVLICGDFNIHVCCPSNQLANNFKSLLQSLDLTQSVSSPTHRLGHTLDLVISRGVNVLTCEVEDFPITDHSLIRIDISAPPPAPTALIPQRRRIITSTTVSQFAAAFSKSQLYASDSTPPPHPDDFLSSFNTICTHILDSFAPLKVKNIRTSSEPWLSDATRELRRQCRRAERKWRKDRLQVSLDIYRESLTTYQKKVKEAKGQYLSNIINNNSHNPRALFSTINSVITPKSAVLNEASEKTCDMFKQYFLDKVQSIKQAITPIPPAGAAPDPIPACHGVMEHFAQVTLGDVKNAIMDLKSTSCPLDIIPAKIMKEAVDTLGPCLVSFINSCFNLGVVPPALKQAIVRPLLKKPNLDPSELSNFRPISNLPLLAKLLEKLILPQLQSHLCQYSILDKFQSGFRTKHSTETALLRVNNDILAALDNKNSMVLVLLDLSAAFDTVDHSVLISRLEHAVGLRESVLNWFTSYLTNRTFFVSINNCSSSTAPLSSGVPQGSILGPILFSLYMLPLGQLLAKHKVQFHFYADDLQIYLPVTLGNHSALDPLYDCLHDIKQWLSQNFLHLNEGKTEYILFCPDSCHSPPSFGPSTPHFSPVVKSLGVMFDSSLNMDKQVSSVVRSCFFQIRLISKVKPLVTRADLEKIIHAFISSRLDYCNALYAGIKLSLLQRLQMVQNAAARLLTNTTKNSHITPVLCSLHWLPVRYRVDFKILLVVFKAIHGLAPAYITELLTIYKPARTLRSSEITSLVVPKSRYKKFGERSFSIHGPKLWNSLPKDLQSVTKLSTFKRQLKTVLFKLAFNS